MGANIKMEEPTMIATDMIIVEYEKAVCKHAPMHSAHEGYAVIKEEFEELWEEIKKQKPDNENMKKEAAQLGAMALRFLTDVCGVVY